MNQNQVNRNKNPLLSCAVTGGFDELSGSGIVLAAAAEKPVFTIGTPAISDTGNFENVSLDRDGTSDTQSNLIEATSRFYSPLAELDSMGNLQNIPNLIQDQHQIDTNMNPISAALAQLPNAASTVFSTFSSIIKGSASNSRLDEHTPLSSGDVIPLNMVQESVNPSYMFEPSLDTNAPPPAFFSPTDDSLFKKQSEIAVTNNNFRLSGAKKKTYAHIPGLSSHHEPASPIVNQNSNMPPMPTQSFQGVEPINHYQAHPIMNSFVSQQKESEKTSMFSLTSLLPSQLLEKIPSTKNLFSSSETTSNYGQQQLNDDHDFSVTTSNYDQQPQPTANFFNVSQSNSFVGISQSEQPQLAPQAPVPAVNFFNPQQFNTSPFTQPKSDQAEINQQVVQNNRFVDLTRPSAVKTPPAQGNFHPNQFSTPYQSSTSEAPKIDAFSAETNFPRPTFFNPVQANDLFKAPLVDDGKPRNPFSNSRLSRGVGLYKTRPTNETTSVQSGFIMPPMPEASNLSQSFQPQIIPKVVEQANIPSISPLPTGNYRFRTELQPVVTNYGQHVSTPPTASTETSNSSSSFFVPPINETSGPSDKAYEEMIASQEVRAEVSPVPLQLSLSDTQELFQLSPVSQQSGFHVFQEPMQPQIRNKSDLNVPETEGELVVNFFQTLPSPPLVSVPSDGINFFHQEPRASDGSIKRDSDCTISATHGFFSKDLPVVSQSNFSTSLANLSTQAVYNDTNINDTISDKLDSMSMSENIGSQLSLFATSELDSSLALKSTVNSECLTLKFLEAQSTVTLRTTTSPGPSKNYRPVYRHWFYQNLYWHPFSMSDSLALDEAISNGCEVVVTDGGRFKVSMKDNRRSPVFWLGGINPIRRCSWFYKNPNASENNLIPFDEATADFMENEYEKAFLNNSWNRQLSLPGTDEYLKMNDSNNIEYYQLGQKLVVKRGVDEFVIDDGEEAPIDHLIISVSNFGDKIDDSADELRSKCMETIEHYYSDARDIGQVGRVEILPINLNSVDVLKLKASNSTIEDAPGGNSELMKSSAYQDIIMKTAFYCNQDYYQNIMNHLAFSLNEIAAKFYQRNPEFKGEISLIATSFEALFLFDLLLTQESAPEFWRLNFKVANFYAFGMPSNLLTIRNHDKLQKSFHLQSCKKFLNVVHRKDPIAQRIEPLIRSEFSKLPPESIENEVVSRIDYTIDDGSSLESFTLRNYFTSEFIILRITNEIYGALKMDSGSL